MRRAVLRREMEILALHERVDETGGEAVPAADAVEDLESGRGVASTKPCSRDHAIAHQSFTVALRTLRSVVAMMRRLG